MLFFKLYFEFLSNSNSWWPNLSIRPWIQFLFIFEFHVRNKVHYRSLHLQRKFSNVKRPYDFIFYQRWCISNLNFHVSNKHLWLFFVRKIYHKVLKYGYSFIFHNKYNTTDDVYLTTRTCLSSCLLFHPIFPFKF